MNVKSQTRLVRRGATYYFRARIPADLQLHFGRKREIMESLRTSDKKAAEQLVRIKSVELDKRFAELRQRKSNVSRTKISKAEIARIVAKATATRMAADEEGRIDGLSDEDFEQHLKWLEEAEAGGTKAVSRGQFEALEPMIDDWLIGHDYDLPKDSEGYRNFAFEFAKAQMRVNQQLRARDRGEPVDTPAMPAELAQTPGSTMENLRDYWKAQKNPRPKTSIEADSIVRRFREVNSDMAPSAVQRKHVIAFRDSLANAGKAPGTVKKLLGLLGGMFQVAVEDEQFGLQMNPVRDVKVRGAKGEAKARRHFSVEELNTIFSSPVYTKGERPKAGAGEAAYWLPLLGLFTGARLNEIGQLRVADVKTEAGVTFIHFTDQGEGLRLKQGSKSRKRVPVHSELVRLGFMRYVERMRGQGSERLFPDLRPDSHGHITGRWSKWFNRYLDDVVGIKEKDTDFHSFRHTFKHHARACGIPEDQHDALTGHANVSVSRTYGGAEGYPLARLAKAMRRLKYGELDLARICPGAAVAPTPRLVAVV